MATGTSVTKSKGKLKQEAMTNMVANVFAISEDNSHNTSHSIYILKDIVHGHCTVYYHLPGIQNSHSDNYCYEEVQKHNEDLLMPLPSLLI